MLEFWNICMGVLVKTVHFWMLWHGNVVSFKWNTPYREYFVHYFTNNAFCEDKRRYEPETYANVPKKRLKKIKSWLFNRASEVHCSTKTLERIGAQKKKTIVSWVVIPSFIIFYYILFVAILFSYFHDTLHLITSICVITFRQKSYIWIWDN